MLTSLDYTNPFPGLRSFEEHEEVYFFGREKQVDELLRKLRTTRFLAVIGSSGSGKSSLIKSGLIPSLHSGFMPGVSSLWRLCSFRPGNDPIGNLSAALSADGIIYNNIAPGEEHTMAPITESVLRRSTSGLVEVYRQAGLDRNTNLLILVDQFEELFRFSRYEIAAKEGKRDSIAFINLLLKAVEQKDLPIYVVFTMRSDFLGDCTAFRGLPEKINEGQYLVPRMSREEKREAISGPVAVGGGDISPGLLNLLLNDVGDNPDQLPILQHALMRTWDVWKRKDPGQHLPLDIKDYEAAGTMRHALSQHAEEAYGEILSPTGKKTCELMFKALTDREVDARGIRRPRTVAEIMELTHASAEEVIGIVEAFRRKGRGFLMPPEEIQLEPSSVIDIAHESLMRVWTRLIGWVEEEGQSAQIYVRLCEAADQYELGKGRLYSGPELQIALKWKEENNPNASWASRYNNRFYKAMLFLEHSKLEHDRKRQHKEAMQKQRLNRARKVMAVVGGVAVVAFLLAIYALSLKVIANNQTSIAQRKEAEAKFQKGQALIHQQSAEKNEAIAREQKVIAEQNVRLAEQEKMEAEKEKRKALASKQIALEQTIIANNEKTIASKNERRALEEERRAKSETERATVNEKVANEQLGISNRLRNLADARVHANGSILLLNEKKLEESRAEAIRAYTLNQNNNGPFQNNDIYNALSRNWNEINSEHVSSLHKLPVRSIVAAPSGNIIYSVDEGGLLLSFVNENGSLQKSSGIDLKYPARNIAVSPGGSKLLILGYHGNGLLLSTKGGVLKEEGKIAFPGTGKSAVFVNDSECIVITSEGVGSYQVTGVTVQLNFIYHASVSAVCVAKDGAVFLASADSIYRYQGWTDLFKNSGRVYTCGARITAISLDASGRYLAAGTTHGIIWLRDLDKEENKTLPLHVSSVNDLKFGEAGTHLQLATAGADQTIKLVDVLSVFSRQNEGIIILSGHSKWIYSISYASDGNYIYSGGEDQKIIAWNTTMEGIYKALITLKN